MNLLAESHNFLDILESCVILLRIGLGHQEHLIILGPALLEITVLLDDGVNDVELGQNVTEVIEDFGVHQLLERLLERWFVLIEETVHLIHDIFR